MIGEHSILELLLQASLIVQLVMLLLIGASVASWAIIFSKRKLLNDARQAADRFEDDFWSGGDLAALYKSLEGGTHAGMADIYVSGFREFSRLRSQLGLAGAQLLDASRRSMKSSSAKLPRSSASTAAGVTSLGRALMRWTAASAARGSSAAGPRPTSSSTPTHWCS